MGNNTSQHVLIPVTPDYYSTIGLPQFLGTLKFFKDSLQDPHNVTPLGVIFTNVPRQISSDIVMSMDRVRKALKEFPIDIPVFDSRMSYFKVYQKTLWQSVPVQKISGRGTRGKGLAVYQLKNIHLELEKKLKTKESGQ